MTLRYCTLLALFSIFIASCGRETGSSTTSSTDSTFTESDAPPVGDFYKRFAGTIGGRQVVLHLHRFDGAVHGNYQYTAIGQTIGLHNWEDTVQDEQFYLMEAPTTEGNNNDTPAHWTITVHGSKATGTWTGPNGNLRYHIELREEYPVGSTQLQAVYYSDSAGLLPDRPSPKATKSYSYVIPRGDAAGFLYGEFVRILDPEGLANGDIKEALAKQMQSYFEDYKKTNAEIATKESNLESFALNYTSDAVTTVYYNDDGLLVIENQQSDYTGGMHGNYGTTFANIDVQHSKLWKVTDMVIDTAALRPVLNDAAIAYFKLKPGEGMEQRMLVDEVPPTANVYLSNTGLTFVYNPYEIASYADGQISLFLPYKKLMPFLTPEFKERMKLTERAGVAMLSILSN